MYFYSLRRGYPVARLCNGIARRNEMVRNETKWLPLSKTSKFFNTYLILH
jgi:hypothetical protein